MTAYRGDPAARIVADVGHVRGTGSRSGRRSLPVNQLLPDAGVSSNLVFVGYGDHAPEQEVGRLRRRRRAWTPPPGLRQRARTRRPHPLPGAGLDDPRPVDREARGRGPRGCGRCHPDPHRGGCRLRLARPGHLDGRERFLLADEPLVVPFAGWIASPALDTLLHATGVRLEDLRAAAEQPGFAAGPCRSVSPCRPCAPPAGRRPERRRRAPRRAPRGGGAQRASRPSGDRAGGARRPDLQRGRGQRHRPGHAADPRPGARRDACGHPADARLRGCRRGGGRSPAPPTTPAGRPSRSTRRWRRSTSR